MRDLTHIKERYMKDETSVRLGGLAANLARIASFSDDVRHRSAVLGLLSESKHFIEWTAPELPSERQEILVQLQINLACWELRLAKGWQDEQHRKELSSNAQGWSETVLTASGLLDQESMKRDAR